MLRDLAERLRLRRERARAQGYDPNFIGFDKYRRSGSYHWAELASNPHYQAKVAVLAGVVDPGHRILDLGCGDGAYLGSLAPGVREGVGIDADPHAIVLATEALRERGIDNTRCVQAPIGAVPNLGLGEFDLVYSMDVIEHLPDPAQLLRVAQSQVRPGGLIIIGTPLFLSAALVSPYHVREFSLDDIRLLLKSELDLEREELMPDKRRDGQVHDRSFYVGVCRAPAG